MYYNLGNMIQFSFFMIQFLPPTKKITIPKYNFFFANWETKTKLSLIVTIKINFNLHMPFFNEIFFVLLLLHVHLNCVDIKFFLKNKLEFFFFIDIIVTRNGKIVWKHIQISLVSWNLPNSPKHWGSILRNMASSERNQLLVGAFHAVVDKTEADILQITKNWKWIWVFIHQGYFFRETSATKCQFCTKVCAPSRLASEVWAIYKDVPTKILKRDTRTNSS